MARKEQHDKKEYAKYTDALKDMAEKVFLDYRDDFRKKGGFSSFPLFVFADKKECEYFKMFLLKEYSNKETSVFLNLKTETLDEFLFQTLKNQEIDGLELNGKKLLTADILKDLIVYILNSEYGKKIIDSDRGLKEFLTSNTINTPGDEDRLNIVNLYDLASNLSRLYVEYSEQDFNMDGRCWQSELYSQIEEVFCINSFAKSQAPQAENRYSDFVSLQSLYKFVSMNTDIVLHQKVYYIDTQNAIKPALFAEIIEKLKCGKSGENFSSFFVKEPIINKDAFQKLMAAPSRIREIEAVHSELCNLIYNNEVENLDDILLLAPNANEYRSAIHQVFSIARDGYPHIHVDLGNICTQSQIASALAILFKSAEKGYYTRKDFFALLNITVVSEKFGISDDDISRYKDAVSQMDVYRNRPSAEDDWASGQERVLLSLLMDKGKEFGGVEAYNTLISMPNDSIAKFSSLINLLEAWIGEFSKSDGKYIPDDMSIDSALRIADILKQLFLNDAYSDDEDIKDENKILRSVIYKIYELTNLYSIDGGISYYVFKETILDSIKDISLVDDMSKKGGVKVASINLLSTICCKYLFLVGFSSNVFCIQKADDVLDMHLASVKDYAANLQKQKLENLETQIALADKFWVSFVNKDLKKDEDFYLSSELEEILKKSYGFVIPKDESEATNKDKYKLLGINWKENVDTDILWTAREYRNMNWVKRSGEV